MTYVGTADLVWQPDIRVSTFPSGLVLVQRSATCRSSDSKRGDLTVGTALTCSGTPEFDGLYIFPETQEKRTAAFTTYDVSAYGRSTEDFVETINDYVNDAISMNAGGVPFGTTTFGLTCIRRGVVPATESTPVTAPTAEAVRTVIICIDGVKTTLTSPTQWQMESSKRTNYGFFDEVVITWKTVVE